jgi:menaquinol-cytochrome c reductase iron-sulfur subunit
METRNMSEKTSATTLESGEQGFHRRVFHLAVIYVLGAVMGLAMAIPTILYLLMPPNTRKRSGFVDAGDVSQLTPGTPVEMSFQQSRVDGWRVVTEKKTAWVVKMPGNGIVAYGPQCTHLGCAYHWDTSAKQFVCPCHSSYFSIQGQVLAGPAPRPLDRYVTRIQDNRLLVGPLKVSSGSNA